MKNLTDFRKTVETGMHPRLSNIGKTSDAGSYSRWQKYQLLQLLSVKPVMSNVSRPLNT